MHALLDGELDSGVDGGAVLLALSEAVVVGDPAATANAREAVVRDMGADAAVDVIGVASNFERMVRIADATGVELGESLSDLSADIRADLHVERPANWSEC